MSNSGNKWTENEENQLLENLNKGCKIDQIAEIHGRSIGAINSRINDIAYKMHVNNIPIAEIMNKTKLEEYEIKIVIENKVNNTPVKKQPTGKKTMEEQIAELKKEVAELKKAVYELSRKIT
jgi:hypothetical protein